MDLNNTEPLTEEQIVNQELISIAPEVSKDNLTIAKNLIDSLIEKIEGSKISEIGSLRMCAGLSYDKMLLQSKDLIITVIKWFGKVILVYTEPYVTEYQNKKCWVWKYQSFI